MRSFFLFSGCGPFFLRKVKFSPLSPPDNREMSRFIFSMVKAGSSTVDRRTPPFLSFLAMEREKMAFFPYFLLFFFFLVSFK